MKLRDLIFLIVLILIMSLERVFIAIADKSYYLSFSPPCLLLVLVYSYRREIQGLDWNAAIKTKLSQSAFLYSLQWAIYAQAASTILFGRGTVPNLEPLLPSYPILAVYIVIVGPIIEEVVFRRILFGTLHKYAPFWLSAGVSSAIFAGMHLSYPRFMGYFLTGVIFCHFYRKSGSLVPIIAAHMVINFIALLVGTLRGG